MKEKDATLERGSEKRKIELEVLTPVHIGSREGRLTALEFLRVKDGIHVIDEEKFGKFLLEKSLIDQFINEVNKGPVQLQKFLKEKARVEIEKTVSELSKIKIPGGGEEMQEFRPFVRDGKGDIYLPGTSIKGVFRTAVVYTLTKKNPALKNQLVSKIGQDNEGEIKKRRRFYSDRLLQKELLQRFDLPGARQGPNPNRDLMRCLIIRDAYPAGEVKKRILRIHFLSKAKEGFFYWSEDKRQGGRDLSVWVEAVVEGKFTTEIIWNQRVFEDFKKHNGLKEFPVSSIDDLLKAIEEMNQDLIEEEKIFFQIESTELTGNKAASSLRNWYEKNPKGLLRVGFGSGMLSTTLGLILPAHLRQKIRDACGSERRPGDPAPKSRRVWRRNENECLPMGWLKLKVDEKKN